MAPWFTENLALVFLKFRPGSLKISSWFTKYFALVYFKFRPVLLKMTPWFTKKPPGFT